MKFAVISNKYEYPGTNEVLGGVYSKHRTAHAAWASYDRIQRRHKRANPGSHLDIVVVSIDADLGDMARGPTQTREGV
jgi:hypothetical protein